LLRTEDRRRRILAVRGTGCSPCHRLDNFISGGQNHQCSTAQQMNLWADCLFHQETDPCCYPVFRNSYAPPRRGLVLVAPGFSRVIEIGMGRSTVFMFPKPKLGALIGQSKKIGREWSSHIKKPVRSLSDQPVLGQASWRSPVAPQALKSIVIVPKLLELGEGLPGSGCPRRESI
jgi:hypothetical protein